MIALFAALVFLTFFRDGHPPAQELRKTWRLLGFVAIVEGLSSLLLVIGTDAFEVQAGLLAVSWALLAMAIFTLGLANAAEAPPAVS